MDKLAGDRSMSAGARRGPFALESDALAALGWPPWPMTAPVRACART
ncbi:hypothetical protein [Rhodanobacter lindaniclasticus]|jgi:hypothetical protein|nr:hypothetical protein [Rhodanobacter lindaniclasticus]